MRTIMLARKPLDNNILETCILNNTSAINIDYSRIGAGQVKQATAGNRTVKWGIGEGGCSYEKGTGASFSREGRWPANVVLEHTEECQFKGTQRAKGYVINRWTDGAKPFGGGAGHAYEGSEVTGTSVEVWDCHETCPVIDLDQQSGMVMSQGDVADHHNNKKRDPNNSMGTFIKGRPAFTKYKDAGGASKFYKQFITVSES